LGGEIQEKIKFCSFNFSLSFLERGESFMSIETNEIHNLEGANRLKKEIAEKWDTLKDSRNLENINALKEEIRLGIVLLESFISKGISSSEVSLERKFINATTRFSMDYKKR
jgi:hypothetical protein